MEITSKIEINEDDWYESQGESIIYSENKSENISVKRLNSLTISISHSTYSPDVVIIGAGPVGLYTAINLKLSFPKLSILIYEKNAEYKRTNLLKLPNIKEIEINKQSCLHGIFSKKQIPIQELENELLAEAKKLGLEPVNFEIDDMKVLYENHPLTKFWIAADGARSSLRKIWYEKECNRDILFHVIQVSYKTENLAQDLSLWRKYALLKKLDMFVEETHDKYQVTIRFFVNEEAFNTVNHFTFKNPCLDINLIDNKEIVNIISLWIKSRYFYLKENGVQGSFKFITYRLDSYCSPYFSHTDKYYGVHVLVGDSAMGVPFYRSLRNGLISSNKLVKFYIEHGKDKKANNFSKQYNNFMETFYSSEKKRALQKTSGVNVINFFVHISSAVPWQVNKISTAKEFEIQQIILTKLTIKKVF